MRFMHVGCGGEIDVKKRMCMRCKKRWDPISFRLDPTGIRPMTKGGRLVPGGESTAELKKKYATSRSYAKWGDKIPGLAVFASRLPRWPRWVRILITVAFVAIVAAVILLIRR